MCYTSLLGLKGCATTEPTTGLYIDTLGITESFLGQLRTDQYNKGSELFDDKLSFAFRKLSSDILGYLSPNMKADTIIEGKRIGFNTDRVDNELTALGAGNYAGVRLRIEPNSKSFLNLYLSNIAAGIDGEVEVLVFDMLTSKKIDTFILTDGNIEQFIGKTFKANRKLLDIAIVYESLLDTTKTVAKIGGCYDCGGRLRMMNICPFVQATGITLTTDGDVVLTSDANQYTYGLTLNYNINCDREAWLCSIGGLMALPLAYATAVEIYDYALITSPSQRVNTVVSLNIETIQQARDIAAIRYTDELKAMLQNMRLPEDNNCFECRSNMKFGTMLP